MTALVVIDRSGQEHVLQASEGQTVMELIRDSGLDEMLALCGGCLSCATCHIHVDEAFLGRLPPVSNDEADLLDSSEHRGLASRLACQLAFQANLAGLRVTIAPED